MTRTSRRLKRARLTTKSMCVVHRIDDESETEREARQLRRQRHAHRPPTVEMQEHLIRCDHEAALKSLVSEAARMRGDAVAISEHSAVRDSQGNGLIERAVRIVEEIVRTLKLDLEAPISETLKITQKVIPWLIEHAVDLVNKVHVGQMGTKLSNVSKGNGSMEILRFANLVVV